MSLAGNEGSLIIAIQAAITKHHRPGHLNNRFISHSSGGQTFKIMVLTDSVPGYGHGCLLTMSPYGSGKGRNGEGVGGNGKEDRTEREWGGK